MSKTTVSGEYSANRITADSLVCDVVGRHPQTIAVFNRYGLRCAGCYISPFHSIADSAREYDMTINLLLDDLNRAIAPEAG
jgi:hybrid cluster-associated redox disulfide protein